MPVHSLCFAQAIAPQDIDSDRRRALIDCWIDVSNAGGAAGFPFPPIGPRDAAPAFDAILENLAPRTCRLLMALEGDDLVGWLNIRRDAFALIAHWGTLHHVQTRTDRRGQGIGIALMKEAQAVARDEMGLEQLHLAARAGVGLETFYGRLGWKEVGRWPGALRLGPGDDRDEVLMFLDLGAEGMTRS
ncbi:GNAT family N-acetyltransferase [Streptomyces sp. NPDC053499]|uniref:GNAT family N-acetyltransferase n=1 Tax=Streptomyces sp. NPDC053499 TaxID=3365707 RepID=UPI0037D7FB2A